MKTITSLTAGTILLPALRRLVVMATVLTSATAHAQSPQPYPTRPLRIIVPFPTGGTIDIVGRITAQILGERLGQNVVVDNRAGAGGILGAELAVKSPPDGHTLCLWSAGSMITSPLLQAKPPYDARRDFTPVSLLAHVPYVLLARPGAFGSCEPVARLAHVAHALGHNS